MAVAVRARRELGLWLEQPGFHLNRCLTLIAARVTAWPRARAVQAKCSFAGLTRLSKLLYAAPTLPFANLRVEQIKCRRVKSVLTVMKPLWN